VFHCFSSSLKDADRILKYGGFKLGIGGVVTFKNSGIDKVVEQIEIENIILETDAPYLTPAPFRGKRNKSSYIPLIANKLSDIYSVSPEEIGKITSKNAMEIFNI
jgi:TatD DNase family protein